MQAGQLWRRAKTGVEQGVAAGSAKLKQQVESTSGQWQVLPDAGQMATKFTSSFAGSGPSAGKSPASQRASLQDGTIAGGLTAPYVPASASAPPKGKPALPPPWLPLEVRCCTWNLHGTPIAAADDIASWLTPDGSGATLIVIAIQEIVELGAKSVVLSQAGDLQRQAALEARVEKVLSNTGNTYNKLVSFGMVGLAMLVYIRAELVPFVTDVDCDRVKTGLQGSGGNKGAVLTRFCIGHFSMCFVNVHLASGQNATAERNAHLADILSDAFQGTSGRGSSRPPKQGFQRQSKYKIPMHHFSVILGDFNARLNVPEKDRRPDGEWQDWLKLDQLLLGLIASLKGFREGTIGFPPTFKYIPGTDTLTDKRIPAWCDRVVFKADYDAHAELFEYTSHELKHTSDHRPVSALFAVAAVDSAWKCSEPSTAEQPALVAANTASWLQSALQPAAQNAAASPWPIGGPIPMPAGESQTDPWVSEATTVQAGGNEHEQLDSSSSDELEETEDLNPEHSAPVEATEGTIPLQDAPQPAWPLPASGGIQTDPWGAAWPAVDSGSKAESVAEQAVHAESERSTQANTSGTSETSPWVKRGSSFTADASMSPWAAPAAGTAGATDDLWTSSWPLAAVKAKDSGQATVAASLWPPIPAESSPTSAVRTEATKEQSTAGQDISPWP